MAVIVLSNLPPTSSDPVKDSKKLDMADTDMLLAQDPSCASSMLWEPMLSPELKVSSGSEMNPCVERYGKNPVHLDFYLQVSITARRGSKTNKH